MDTTERTIRREFPGPANAGVRQKIRKCLQYKTDPMALQHTIAFTARGLAGIRAVCATLAHAPCDTHDWLLTWQDSCTDTLTCQRCGCVRTFQV